MKTRIATIGLATAALIAPAAAANAATYSCQGVPATIVSRAKTINGTSGNDVIVALGSKKHTINGKGGNDIICGSSKADVIKGGAGNDVLVGNAGNDNLLGQSGTDTLIGGTGNDSLNGGTGDDDLDGNDGTDSVTGGSGVDVIHVDGVRDHVHSDSSDDVQRDSVLNSLSADELLLSSVLQQAAQDLYTWAQADNGSVGNQATLPDGITTSVSVEDQALYIKHVTWDTTLPGEHAVIRGCVDGTVDPADTRYFKVRIDPREGHESRHHTSSSEPTYRVTLGTCAQTWEHQHEGSPAAPGSLAAAVAAVSGVTDGEQKTSDEPTWTSGTLFDLMRGGTVMGAGDINSSSVPNDASESAVQALLTSAALDYPVSQIVYSSGVNGHGDVRRRACLVVTDLTADPDVVYHQSIEVSQESRDGRTSWKTEAVTMPGDCSLAGHDD